MGSLQKRTGALEEYIESQIEERMRLEVEAMLDLLEEKLTREELETSYDGSSAQCRDSWRPSS